MSYNGHSGSHWVRVARHFMLDTLLVVSGFYLATTLRLPDAQISLTSLAGWFVGAMAFASTSYIFGLYASEDAARSLPVRSLYLAGSLVTAFVVMAIFFYFCLTFHVGRGIMGLGWLFSLIFVLPHHLFLHQRQQRHRERIAYVLLDESDEAELSFLHDLRIGKVRLQGVITSEGYTPSGNDHILGSLSEISAIMERERLSYLVCSGQRIGSPATQEAFRMLRYSGFRVVPMVAFCEDVYKFVPLKLASDLWLYHASIVPHSLYIRKLKRAFDICGSLAGIVLFSPALLLGLLSVRLTSPGPLLYRQVRLGKNGRPFEVLKLRTMRVDAESEGAKWSAGHRDPRLTPVGGFLRKYRIDEIPQFINVLKGEMSFVGPRPERPEFVDVISKEIPLFRERLMIPPGITGWAQVNYPYGASITDAGHKLEYDFYYMKHMNLVFDALILLDTVRLIIRGGLGSSDVEARRWIQASRSYSGRLTEKVVPAYSMASKEASVGSGSFMG